MYGKLAASYGWTFAVIDEMTWLEAADALGYLRENPPTHLLLADFIEIAYGVKVRSRAPSSDPERLGSKEDLQELTRQMGGGG